MRKLFLALILAVALPLVSALNCTNYQKDQYQLCNSIQNLPLPEDQKISLMQPDALGYINDNEKPISLSLNGENDKITLEEIYRDKISFIVKLSLFILINYVIYSFLTKYSKIIKWLSADY